jgi:hypothetical protein
MLAIDAAPAVNKSPYLMATKRRYQFYPSAAFAARR